MAEEDIQSRAWRQELGEWMAVAIVLLGIEVTWLWVLLTFGGMCG